MSKNIVYEGWLTKSPPTKRIWRAKWRRRWFALRQSGELPGQYFLDYYADRDCRRLKGTINLDLCEQVDAGLHMERGNGTLDPKIRGSVFTVRTQSRTYHLEADCESDMEKWVEAICKVCGLRATSDNIDVLGNPNIVTSVANDQYECSERGLYIPISECITGVRVQNSQRAFTFDPKNIVTSNRTFERVSTDRSQHMYTSQPHIRLNNIDLSENESNISDEDCKSLNASQSNIGDWSATKSFTKLAISPQRNGVAEDGPPVPPRPPKPFQGPKMQEPVESNNDTVSLQGGQTSPWLRLPRRMSHGNSPTSPARPLRCTDDEDDNASAHPSMQYFNLGSLPPAVDRALKPRHSSIGHINTLLFGQNPGLACSNDDDKADVLQYLDLDLHTSKPAPPKPQATQRQKIEIAHGKSLSAVDADSAYKTVDFLKTEAFNITRQDAEASRSTQL